MRDNRLVKLIESNPEILEKLKNENNKDNLVLFLSGHINNYSENEAKRDLRDIWRVVELQDDALANISGGAKTPVYIERISDKDFANTVKKLIGIFGLLI